MCLPLEHQNILLVIIAKSLIYIITGLVDASSSICLSEEHMESHFCSLIDNRALLCIHLHEMLKLDLAEHTRFYIIQYIHQG
jgi:hypothetical protein